MKHANETQLSKTYSIQDNFTQKASKVESGKPLLQPDSSTWFKYRDIHFSTATAKVVISQTLVDIIGLGVWSEGVCEGDG